MTDKKRIENLTSIMKEVDVTIRLTSEMLGTVAMDQSIYTTWTESKKPTRYADENESETVENMEDRGLTGFHKDENGLFIYNYMVMGFLKHAGNTLKEVVSVKALRSKLDNFCFVNPRRIYLEQEEPDGILERPLRATTPQGPRVAITRSFYVKAGKELQFAIRLLPHKEINFDLLDTLLQYGQLAGLGQWRSGGYGQFEIVDFVCSE